MTHHKTRRAIEDFLVISAIVLAVLVLAHVFDVYEALTSFSRRYEGWNVAEILFVALVFGLAFAVYSWRRWRDLREEIARRKELEEQLAHQALHDYLTGIPNRRLFMEHLENALARASRGGEPVTVLFVDLDDFKAVNDEFGHEVGDRLLVAVSDNLQMFIRPGDVVARIGGDEFIVLLENPASRNEAAGVAGRIVASFDAPFRLGEHDVRVSASVGAALTTGSGEDAGLLLRNADSAMYRAKRSGKARYEVFDGTQI